MEKIRKIRKITKDFEETTDEKPLRKSNKVDVSRLVPTGSTTFNLECSGHIEGAFLIGKMINLIGDSHAGKCIKNAYILTSKGMEKIDDIGSDKNFGITPYSEELSTSKGISDTTSHFWKEEVSKTIEVRTKHGYSLEGTEDHPIMIFTPGFTFEMKKLKDIRLGDCAIIARGTNNFPDVLPSIPNVKVTGTNVKIANIPEVINEGFARLLGYIVADGNFSTNCIHISNTKRYVVDDINKICESLNVNFNDDKIISSKHLWKTMLEIFGNTEKFTARIKYVPECILLSPKSIQASFLQALIDCDSWGNDRQITYNTASEVLAKQVHLMLLNFGIISSLQSKNGAFDGVNFQDHIYWSVSFYGDELNIYKEKIGSNKYSISNKSEFRNSDFDSVPNLVQKMKEDIDKLRVKLGWSVNGRCKNYDGHFPRIKFASTVNGSKKMIKEFIHLFEKLPIDLSLYKFIDKSGYHFDMIESVICREKKTVVYDVHIPETHLFWSNGFISHNTLFALTVFAECSLDSRFDNFRFINDDVEDANEFDIAYLFNKELADRIENIRSKTIEEFNDNLARNLRDKRPCIYLLDSFDGLTSEAALEKDEDNRKAREKGNAVTGSYGDGKAKKASEMFSQRIQELSDSGSVLMIISQTRDNIGFGAKFTPKVRSGGKALKFYAFHEIWLACQKREKEGKRVVSTNVQAKITKNKLTGRHGEAYFPVLFDYGVDNIKSCIHFMIDEGDWTGTAGSINTKGFIPQKTDAKGNPKHRSLNEIIKHIESNDLEEELFQLCQKTYDTVMENLKPKRKRKY